MFEPGICDVRFVERKFRKVVQSLEAFKPRVIDGGATQPDLLQMLHPRQFFDAGVSDTGSAKIEIRQLWKYLQKVHRFIAETSCTGQVDHDHGLAIRRD